MQKVSLLNVQLVRLLGYFRLELIGFSQPSNTAGSEDRSIDRSFFKAQLLSDVLPAVFVNTDVYDCSDIKLHIRFLLHFLSPVK